MNDRLKIVPHPVAGELFSGDMIEEVGKAKDQWIRMQMEEEAAAERAAKDRMRAANQTHRSKNHDSGREIEEQSIDPE